ncbi:FAD/NAD(P)-binding domain-containing protein [Ceraceosorus guamensis]|uniref:FAD/NAD(P)-binding domain-containing protein n=1 Tax=Ceraceosorus guamensis TaxID=1522189 RepID=A0A316VUC4_9BASI|nr:FAD/NAD(P)-binding domain-containing protein [Ceraceosorus guamensis]PWN41040.1 FAD/NAD(P)-binding domain-containing protein [Ceraceosorus guamensis]
MHRTHPIPARVLPVNPALDSSGKIKPRVVVLGSGWGAMTVLKSIDHSKYEVVCVSPNSSFNMTPLLAQAAVGSLDFKATMESVRSCGSTQLYHAWADGIDTTAKHLLLTPAYPPAFRTAPPATLGPDDAPMRSFPNARGRQYLLPYDKLVISVGAYNRTFKTPGVRENAWFLKDVQNARSIRWRILEVFEMADHPTMSDEQRRQLLSFIVVGGGPTGSEFAAELHDLVKSDLTRIFPKVAPLAQITLIDASSGILSSFDASLSTYARQKFKRDGIKILLERQVKRVDRGRLVVEPDGEIPFGLLVWSTGVCSTPLVKSITCIKKDERNSFLYTNEHLHALASQGEVEATSSSEATPSAPKVLSDVYAIGDCAQIDGVPLPATAQVAAQKGKYVASVLNGKISPETKFTFKNMGQMAALGGGKAIVDSPQAKIHGRWAWIIWRSAYTFMSLSNRNRILVPFFWAVNRIFGRDLNRF